MCAIPKGGREGRKAYLQLISCVASSITVKTQHLFEGECLTRGFVLGEEDLEGGREGGREGVEDGNF